MDTDEALQRAADAIDDACHVMRPLPYGPVRARLSDAQVAVHDALRSRLSAREGEARVTRKL